MVFAHSRRLIQGAWNRRWFRRVTYLIASGAALAGAGLWTVRQPFFNRWLIDRLDTLVKEETGLSLEAEAVEFHPVQGRLVLRRFAVGGDLLKADRLDVRVDFITLLGRRPHIWNVELENPASVLDAQRLAKIRLKPRPDQGARPLVRLDRVSITGGRMLIQEPAWRLPRAEFTYRVSGRGIGPNRLEADVQVPRCTIGEGGSAMEGGLSAKVNLSDLSLEVKESEIRLGRNQLSATGNFSFEERMLSTDLQGRLDVAEAAKLLDSAAPATWQGTTDFRAQVRGALSDPVWNLTVHGRGLSSRSHGLQPGDAEVIADGSLRHANIRELTWDSPQGRIEASGEWKKGEGSRLAFRCNRFGLAPVASLARADFLQDLSVDLEGNAAVPGDPWALPQLDAVVVDAEGRFVRAGAIVGQLSLHLAGGQLKLEDVALAIPEVEVEGRATVKLGKRSLQSVAAEALARTDVGLVADVLHAWDIGEGRDGNGAVKLGMGGLATARASLEWDPAQGIRLGGHAEVMEPRWHGAIMDRLQADVSIENDELRIENVEALKGEGSATGTLWLTWSGVPPGQDQIDMRFQASDLPIQEGLRAGDAGDLPITGTGGGWVRIHGPYRRLRIEANGLARDADVYGFAIPAASGSMVYDIAGGRLEVTDARVAESVDQLGAPDEAPSGPLALRGDMDMDLVRRTWQVRAEGDVDSRPLGLPGPRFQAQVEARFEGPWTVPFGPVSLPLGSLAFSHGRLFLDQQSIEELEGRLTIAGNALRLEAGSQGKPEPFLDLEAQPKGAGLLGTARVHIAPDSVETARLASRLSQDLLMDGSLELQAEGAWDAAGLRWKATMDRLEGYFDGFDLKLQGPATLAGDEAGTDMDLRLQGHAISGADAAHLHVTGRIPFAGTAPADVRIEGEAELANLKGIIDHILKVDDYSLLADLKPEGNARFDLKLGGPLLEPVLDGQVSLQGGRLQVRAYPQSIEDLAFNLHFKGRDVYLLETDPLQGRIAQGALSAWGTATWEFGGLSAYDLQTRVRDFQLRDLLEGTELYGDLDAVFQGTKEEGGILSGTILARRMTYQTDINLRDLILASAMGGSRSLLGTDPNDPLTQIDLDLDLVLSQPWEFDTNLLKLQGRPVGTFKIQGTLAEPGLKGKMDILPGGRLTNLLPAGDVVLERGTIEWTNPQVLYPTLDLLGRVDVPPYVVNLSIRGNLDGLEMKQWSTPSLRQDEITAILIDPSLAPDLGSLSGTTSQASIGSGLASTGSGLLTTLALANFQESLRRTLKLDRVSVAWRTGTGINASETSVTVGKSVDLFGRPTPFVVTHQKSGDAATTSGQVEWRFGNFVLLLGVSQSGTNAAAPSGEIRHTWSPGW